MCDFMHDNMPAEGLAQLDTRPSGGKVMTKFSSHKYLTLHKAPVAY